MEPDKTMFIILGLALRILGVVVCTSKAKELNRSTGSWGFFGFLFPVIAMISIQFMKPITNWESNVDTTKDGE